MVLFQNGDKYIPNRTGKDFNEPISWGSSIGLQECYVDLFRDY